MKTIYLNKSNSTEFNSCLYFAKQYELDFFKGIKSNVILDDYNNRVVIKDSVVFKLTNDAYLSLYDCLVEYRKLLWKQLQ